LGNTLDDPTISCELVDLGDIAIPCELVDLGIVVELGDPAIRCELVDLGIVVELDDPAIPRELLGRGAEVELDERAIDWELVGRRISGKRNTFSLILSIDDFSFTSDLVAADVLPALEDSPLAVASEALSFLCDANGVDVIALSEDFSFTAALEDSSWLCKSAGASVAAELEGFSTAGVLAELSVLWDPVKGGKIVPNDVSFAAALGSQSDSCDLAGGGGGGVAAKLEGVSLLVVIEGSSPCGLLDDCVAAELDGLSFAVALDGLLPFRVQIEDFSSLGDSLDCFSDAAALGDPLSLDDSLACFSDAAALGDPLSLCDLVTAVLGKSTFWSTFGNDFAPEVGRSSCLCDAPDCEFTDALGEPAIPGIICKPTRAVFAAIRGDPPVSCDLVRIGFGNVIGDPPISCELVRSGLPAALEDSPSSRDFVLSGGAAEHKGTSTSSDLVRGIAVAAFEDPRTSCDSAGGGTSALRVPSFLDDPVDDPAAAPEEIQVSCGSVDGSAAPLDGFFFSFFFCGSVCGVALAPDGPPISSGSIGGVAAELDDAPVSCDSIDGPAAAPDDFLVFFFRDLFCDAVASSIEDASNSSGAVVGPGAVLEGPSVPGNADDGPSATLDISPLETGPWFCWLSKNSCRTCAHFWWYLCTEAQTYTAETGRSRSERTKNMNLSLGNSFRTCVLGLASRNERSWLAEGLILGSIWTIINTSGFSIALAIATRRLFHPLVCIPAKSQAGGSGGSTPRISKLRMPRFHRSTALVWFSTFTISGHMYAQLPQKSRLGGPPRAAELKSARTKCSLLLQWINRGLMSRCMMFLLCKNSTALTIWMRTVL
jgi:hypothetical protein